MISRTLLLKLPFLLEGSKKAAREQVVSHYRTLDSMRELDATLWHYSRVATYAALEALFVYNAEHRLDTEEAKDIAGLSRNFAIASSMKDEWLDEIYVKRYLARDLEKINEETIRNNLADVTWRPDILENPMKIAVKKPKKILGKRIGEEIRIFDHEVYFNAPHILLSFLSNAVLERSEEAYDALQTYKAKMESHQAKDMAIGAYLVRGEGEKALQTLGTCEYKVAIDKCRELLNKLGTMGGALPVIAHRISCQSQEHSDIDHLLYSLGSSIVNAGQLLFDDVPNCVKDWEEGNPNMIILPAMTLAPDYKIKNREQLGLILYKNNTILSELLGELSEVFHYAAEELDTRHFAGDEAKYIIKKETRRGVEQIRKLGRSLGVEFDEGWYKAAKEMQSKW